MARRLFFADLLEEGAAAPPRRAIVRGAEARHLAQVLRVRPGMRFELAAGGQRYLGAVAAAAPAQVTFDLLQRLAPAAPAAGPRLLAAVCKFDRFEWMLEKAVELGVAAIQPLAAGRCEPRLLAAAAARRDRWQRILQAAAQQSRRQEIPAIAPPLRWADLDGLPPRPANPQCRWLLSEDPAAAPLAAALPAASPGAVALAVGPEGGWTDGDRAAAAALGFVPYSLGPRILRAETAAIAALAYLAIRAAGTRPAPGA